MHDTIVLKNSYFVYSSIIYEFKELTQSSTEETQSSTESKKIS